MLQPTPPAVPTPPVPGEFQVVIPTDGASPSAILKAMEAQRSELRDQLERVQEQRNDIANWLKNDEITAPDREGWPPGSRKPTAAFRVSSSRSRKRTWRWPRHRLCPVPSWNRRRRPTAPTVTASGDNCRLHRVHPVCPVPHFLRVCAAPLEAGATVIAPVPREVTDRLEQMGQAVESIAIEVERIGEGQRFLTRVMGDQTRQLGVGAAQPIAVNQGQKVAEPLR